MPELIRGSLKKAEKNTRMVESFLQALPAREDLYMQDVQDAVHGKVDANFPGS
jgi:hypothetical protein